MSQNFSPRCRLHFIKSSLFCRRDSFYGLIDRFVSFLISWNECGGVAAAKVGYNDSNVDPDPVGSAFIWVRGSGSVSHLTNKCEKINRQLKIRSTFHSIGSGYFVSKLEPLSDLSRTGETSTSFVS